jgi:hypothetical protein
MRLILLLPRIFFGSSSCLIACLWLAGESDFARGGEVLTCWSGQGVVRLFVGMWVVIVTIFVAVVPYVATLLYDGMLLR